MGHSLSAPYFEAARPRPTTQQSSSLLRRRRHRHQRALCDRRAEGRLAHVESGRGELVDDRSPACRVEIAQRDFDRCLAEKCSRGKPLSIASSAAAFVHRTAAIVQQRRLALRRRA